jgi:glucosamine-6-phosphate deaminase
MTASPELLYGTARVRIYSSRAELGAAAAEDAASIIRKAVAERGRARIILATGNSQLDMIGALVEIPEVPWTAVEVFHMDEYVGMPETHPSSFRLWIRTRVEERVHPRVVQYLAGDAPDPEPEMERYSRLLNAAPIDLAFVGFGENGHIAFNDPHVADFNDCRTLKRVLIDEASQRQQAGEGHFDRPESVPRDAFTITCPGLFRAAAWICCVPDLRKANAVRDALEGPISTACPASIVRTHPGATVYLDTLSASRLTLDNRSAQGPLQL